MRRRVPRSWPAVSRRRNPEPAARRRTADFLPRARREQRPPLAVALPRSPVTRCPAQPEPMRLRACAVAVALLGLLGSQNGMAAGAAAHPVEVLIGRYCRDCHRRQRDEGGFFVGGNRRENSGGRSGALGKGAAQTGSPADAPVGEERPTAADYARVVATLQAELDRAAAAAPNPGRTDTFRRLNRTEYRNAIRDLLALEIDATALLPNDEPAHGFDNITVGTLSPTLLERYVTAAQKIARLAVGAPRKTPGGDTFRVPPDLTQEGHIQGLPLGTRGGAVIPYTFPLDGDSRDSNPPRARSEQQVEGLKGPHDVEFSSMVNAWRSRRSDRRGPTRMPKASTLI